MRQQPPLQTPLQVPHHTFLITCLDGHMLVIGAAVVLRWAFLVPYTVMEG